MPSLLRMLPLLLVVGAAEVRGDEATARFFDGLRERRLFSLAEGECLDRLAPGNVERLSDERRAELVVELSRTYAEHGRFAATGDEQDELWGRATAALTDYLATEPPAAARLRVELQRGFLPAGQGEFLARQVEVQPYDTELRDRAARLLDGAIRSFEALEKQLAGWQGPLDGSPSPAEVRRALYNVQFRLAVTRLDRAELLERTDADRADHLNRAEQAFVSLAGGDPGDVTTQRCRVLLARTRRLKGRPADGVRVLGDLLEGEERLAGEVRDELEAERARLVMVLGRPDEAAAALEAYRRERGRLTGELRFEKARALIGMWRATVALDEPQVAAEALERLRAHVAATEFEVGGYWGVRCRVLFEYAVRAAELGPELAGVVREADGRYLAGERGAAIDGYRRAIDLATTSGRDDLLFDFALTLGSMQIEAGDYEAAATDLAAVVERFPTDERTPRASLLAAYALGRVYDREKTGSSREAYVAALERHRRAFPDDPTAGEATWLLARLHELRLQYTDALREYLAIPFAHDRGPVAAAAAARMYETILRLLRSRRQPTGDWERSARERLALVVAELPPRPAPLALPAADVVTSLARLLVTTEPRDFDAADRLLERVTGTWDATVGGDDSDPDRERWRETVREAMQLRIVSLAGRGDVEGATLLVRQDIGDEPQAALELLDGLTGVIEAADDRLVRQFGQLQLAVAEPLAARRDDLDETTRKRLDVCLVEARLATGSPNLAVAIAQRLLAAHPRDGRLTRALAERLVDCGLPECVQAAKPAWRRLERSEREGTPTWFECRYRVAWCALELGEYDECRKLLGVTRALHPDLGGEAWRPRFEELERELRAAR